jgi:hypothetical protein
MSVVVANGARISSLGYGTYGMRRGDMLRMIPHVLSAGCIGLPQTQAAALFAEKLYVRKG